MSQVIQRGEFLEPIFKSEDAIKSNKDNVIVHMSGVTVSKLFALFTESENDDTVCFRKFTCKVLFYAGDDDIEHPAAVFNLEYGKLQAIPVLG